MTFTFTDLTSEEINLIGTGLFELQLKGSQSPLRDALVRKLQIQTKAQENTAVKIEE